MYSRPARRRAVIGIAGARARQVPADRHSGPYEEFLSRHEAEAQQAARSTQCEQGEFARCLLQRAGDSRNVMLAIEHCAARGQAAGPNGLRPSDLDRTSKWSLARELGRLIQSGAFRPSRPRTIRISKGPGRGDRPIHIQNLEDRVAQRAVLQVIRPLVEPHFLDCSFGFRQPGRSREEALATAERIAIVGERWTWVCQDLRNAFENVPRQRLMQIARTMIPADDTCAFIDRLVKQPTDRRGIRQGDPLSPFLLNVYLHHLLDKWWRTRFENIPMIRVADDLLVVARHEEVERFYGALEAKLRSIGMPLKHSAEVAVRDLGAGQKADWLGYKIQRDQDGLSVGLSEKTWFNLEEALRLAWEEPSPTLSANMTILGWIEQQGVTYHMDGVRETYAGIARRARCQGFNEIPDRAEIASRWQRAHLRWVRMRRVVLCQSRRGFADGFADQHCETAVNSDRRGATRLREVPPQTTPIRREVSLYCDGSCLGSQGVGGWAYLVVDERTGVRRSDAGADTRTTNNRMELTAVVRGLASLTQPTRVHLIVDSEYVHLGITRWLADWSANGWRAGRDRTHLLKNRRYWQQLAEQLCRHDVDSQWIRGHSGNPENHFVDQLARHAAEGLAASRRA